MKYKLSCKVYKEEYIIIILYDMQCVVFIVIYYV